MANDGEATSRGSAPSAAAIARARNVLPLPRSPTRWTIALSESIPAISRPATIVSSSERQIHFIQMGCALPGSETSGSRNHWCREHGYRGEEEEWRGEHRQPPCLG